MRFNFYYLVFALFVIVALRHWWSRSKVVHAKKEQLKSLYRNQTVFLCEAGEDLGDGHIQLYGESFGTSVRPGMKIVGTNGAEYTIKEVYANDKTPDVPDPEVPAGVDGTPIVIETSSWDWNSFKQNIKRDKVVALKLYNS